MAVAALRELRLQTFKRVTHAEIKEEIRLVEAITAALGQEIEMANKPLGNLRNRSQYGGGCCFNRPILTVQDVQGVPVGSVVDPCTCCNLVFHAKDTIDFQHRYGRQIGEIVKKIKCCKWLIQEDELKGEVAAMLAEAAVPHKLDRQVTKGWVGAEGFEDTLLAEA
eukprot:Skav232450  [mRNA]  locus=scaffold189:472577:487389:- [translate_table: standard]